MGSGCLVVLWLLTTRAVAEPAPPEAIELQVISRVTPTYPAAARDLGLPPQRCVVHVSIDATGVPREARVDQCPEAFHEDAAQALLQWRWHPPMAAGRPVDTSTIIGITFRLHEETRTWRDYDLEERVAAVLEQARACMSTSAAPVGATANFDHADAPDFAIGYELGRAWFDGGGQLADVLAAALSACALDRLERPYHLTSPSLRHQPWIEEATVGRWVFEAGGTSFLNAMSPDTTWTAFWREASAFSASDRNLASEAMSESWPDMDVDLDGLTNAQEEADGTDPWMWDSSGDGTWDGGEPPPHAVVVRPGHATHSCTIRRSTPARLRIGGPLQRELSVQAEVVDGLVRLEVVADASDLAGGAWVIVRGRHAADCVIHHVRLGEEEVSCPNGRSLGAEAR